MISDSLTSPLPIFLQYFHNHHKVSKKLNDQTVPPKTDVELSCVIPDGPETKTQWFKDGKPIKVPSDKYDEKVVGNKRVLVVKSASVEDQGQFACETPKFKSAANLQVTTKRKCAIFLELQLNPLIMDVKGDQPI